MIVRRGHAPSSTDAGEMAAHVGTMQGAEEELKHTLGDWVEVMIIGNVKASVMVHQGWEEGRLKYQNSNNDKKGATGSTTM